MIGKTISHYRIVEKLGEGGMGVVYLAEDTVLDRKVAIKFLSLKLNENEQAKKRLLREARAVAKLDQPNICHIYEVGEEDGRSFIAMQYVDGETLASKNLTERPSLTEAVNIAIQVTDAVADAHAHGILHRDIKPENIIIAPNGHVKVLDFGLAKKLEGHFLGNDADTLSLVTQSGLLIGTLPYMSPEQVRAEKLDERSDIFSIGTVLYEMLSGKQPFTTGNPAQSIAAILTSDPESLKSFESRIPPELDRIVLKCLEKDRERRYQSARDLLVDLREVEWNIKSTLSGRKSGNLAAAQVYAWQKPSSRWLAAALVIAASLLAFGAWYLLGSRSPSGNQPATRTINSIAVLPFENEKADPEIEYLCDGLTESLINSLSQMPNMKVIARSSVFRYKGQGIDLRSVGHNLNVQALLVGHVVQHRDDFSISIELVDVEGANRLWGEQYHRKLSDLLSMQGEMSTDIIEKLTPTLSGTQGKQVARTYTNNTEAYELYLKGRYDWNKRTVDSLARATDYFQQAIQKDPNYALAYVGLADCYLVSRMLPGKEISAKATEAALKALSIDHNLAEAHASLGFARSRYDWNWEEAREEFQRAIQLNPNYSIAYYWYADLLMALDRQADALAQLRRAQELDPLSPTISTTIGQAIFYQRDYDHAIQQLLEAIKVEPDFWAAHFRLGLAYSEKGNYSEAVNELQTATTLSGNSSNPLAMLGYAYAVSGKPEKARQVLSQLNELSKQRHVSPYYFAVVYIGLRQKNQAFQLLEKAAEEHDPGLVTLKVEPLFDSLRSDPRFSALTQRVGFPS